MAQSREGRKDHSANSAELDRLRRELEESQETLRAIRSGEVDALVVSTNTGDKVFTLKGADESYRVLLEQLTEGALTVSSDGVVLYTNARFASFLKKDLDGIIGAKLQDIVHESDRGLYLALLNQGKSANVRGIVKLVAEDGSIVPTKLSVSALPSEGSIIWCIVASDMTDYIKTQLDLQRSNEELERKVKERTYHLTRANAELARSNTDLQQFAYIASHDLRQPLRSISGFLELIQMDCAKKLDAQVLDYIRRAVDASFRLDSMIEDLLDYSRVDTRGRDFTEVDLNDVCKAAINDLHRTIGEHATTVEVKPLPTVMADEAQIARVFRNLIDNAIKFQSETKPKVTVSASKRGGEWLISVKDNGIGIDPANHNKIFELFAKLHSRDEFPGSGIGLAITKKIVERHGGRIWVKSSLGSGSDFLFTLPSKDESPFTHSPSHSHRSPS